MMAEWAIPPASLTSGAVAILAAAAAPGAARAAAAASAERDAEAAGFRLAGRTRRTPSRPRAYRAQCDRSRLGHHRALLARTAAPRLFRRLGRRGRTGGRSFRAAGAAAGRFRSLLRRPAGP